MFKYIKGTKKLCRYPLLHRNCSCRILEIIALKSKERPQYSKIQMKNESKIDLNFAILYPLGKHAYSSLGYMPSKNEVDWKMKCNTWNINSYHCKDDTSQ